jgi:hypothetical protein
VFEDLPKSRAEAIKKGSSYYYTGEPCTHGHVDRRRVNGGCHKCWKIAVKKREKLLIQIGREAVKPPSPE